MLRLSGKVAFITGGGTGIGRACALAFAREGAQVAVAGRRKDPLDKVAGEIAAAGGKSVALCCDVTQRSSVESALAEAEKHFGRLDTIVNNAGAVVVATVEHTSDEEWDRVLAANLTGTFLVSRAALASLRRAGGGSIVNIGSVLGLVARKDRAAYCAAKAGVSGLTRAMALDHAHEKIRVNCICPTIVETELGMQSVHQTAERGGRNPKAHRGNSHRAARQTGRRGHHGGISGFGRRVVGHRRVIPTRRRPDGILIWRDLNR